MIKCIASDMDGTLLNSRQEISELNRKAILFAKDQGVEFVIATGRSYDEAKVILEATGINCPIIAANGAEIRNIQGDIVSTTGIDKEHASSIINVLSQLDIYFEVYTSKGKYTKDQEKSISVIVDIFHTANPERPIEEIRSTIEDRFVKGFIQTVDDYGKVLFDSDCVVYKIIAFSKDEKQLTMANASLKALKEIKITSSGHNNLEINHIDAQKGIALEAFVKSKGITLKETMAIGDNFNDLSMLKKVGYPVAMGNAEDEIKKVIANHTVKNDEDGVGKAIYQVLNGQAVK
ncbi:Cof-type HAD-IIB family hydrolase [Heyndrickxia vini]|uniref:HAD family phosphatase n=1 Tax=Heyndrickxia vini TaxID=1476025 RepID=A0ABX7E163_9BACI|nr:Cof-type HAD-IIB family hydrolase [Heyndrickxia vini]QQZ09272.1 HAD family phosphatase [Heyndrickxia vini]